jgi:hypothetical protein
MEWSAMQTNLKYLASAIVCNSPENAFERYVVFMDCDLFATSELLLKRSKHADSANAHEIS